MTRDEISVMGDREKLNHFLITGCMFLVVHSKKVDDPRNNNGKTISSSMGY